MPPHLHCRATPRPCCQATPQLHCQVTNYPDLWHLLGQRLTWTIIVSFCLHLNRQKNARATQVINLPITFYLFVIGLWVQCQKVYTIPHIKNGVQEEYWVEICQNVHCAHEGCKVKVHRFCQIDWLHWHGLEVNYDDPIFCLQHNKCYQNYVQFFLVLQQAIPELSLIKARQYHAEGE